MVYCDIVVGSLKFKYTGTRSQYNGDRMDIDIQTYRINQLLRIYRAVTKYDKSGIESYNISLNPFKNDQSLSENAKKKSIDGSANF